MAIPIALIAGLLGVFTGATVGLEKKVKDTILEVGEKKLQNVPNEAVKHIDSEIIKKFGLAKERVMKEVSLVIDQEEQHIQRIMEMNQLSQTEKERQLLVLSEANNRVDTQRKVLKEVMVLVQQVS